MFDEEIADWVAHIVKIASVSITIRDFRKKSNLYKLSEQTNNNETIYKH